MPRLPAGKFKDRCLKVLDSGELPQPFHGDPADQLIVASARHHGAVLVTRDGRLRGYSHVQTAW